MATTDSTSGTDPNARRLDRRSLLRMVGAPMIVLTLLTTLLGIMYLAYVVDPEENLHDFPIALVNQDVGETFGSPGQERRVNFGDQVADGLRKSVPADQIDLRVVGISEAERQMQSGKVYGAIIIPSDFSKRLGILGVGSVVPGDIEQPIITLQTNPRAGTYASAIVVRVGDRAFPEVNKQVGEELTRQVQAQLAPPEGGQAPELSGATRIALASPLQLIVEEFRPLPSNTGQGLTAFFYALLLLLAGVIGSMTIHTMVDANLGFVPTEYGPWYVHFPPTPISRFKTLLLKWGVMILMGSVVSLIYMLVAKGLGMPIENPLALFVYSAFAIIAVGITGLSILAALGSAGLLVNLILFIVLGLPSSGGTVPIEATPKYFGWLALFEPMHQVFLAVRSILYFDASGPAGLTRGFWMTLIGLVIGLVLGAVITRYYDYKGLHRGRPVSATE
ncbi:YhgE/Pip-like protein [Nocardia bhagyanarayanae]|uniref:YhgE/Pip-like protein n=2 Tax=Nocardia bhagyanarayanae TaxID=1215925 RepID=A0A543F598_9NOCA|nr:YhgE/Pip-like protein [Nocardia bhagyanarayanae]